MGTYRRKVSDYEGNKLKLGRGSSTPIPNPLIQRIEYGGTEFYCFNNCTGVAGDFGGMVTGHHSPQTRITTIPFRNITLLQSFSTAKAPALRPRPWTMPIGYMGTTTTNDNWSSTHSLDADGDGATIWPWTSPHPFSSTALHPVHR